MEIFRFSAIYFIVIALLCVPLITSDDGNSTEEQKFVYDDGVLTETIAVNRSYVSKEDGNFNFFGRNIINTIRSNVKKIGNFGKQLLLPSNTTGLDTNRTFFSGAIDSFKKHIKFIYPGTQWCGDGDRARNYDDLGMFELTDKCCRQHDKCPTTIPANEIRFGLKNSGLFTRSLCDCDKEFYTCLKHTKTLVSRQIGFTYFSILGPQCFSEEFPKIGCKSFSKGKCIDYFLNETLPKIFQWFDSPLF